MSVSARSAKKTPEMATVHIGRVDMRTGTRPLAGSFMYEGERLVTGWHSHDLDEINYALSGVIEVETARSHYLLPPQQAVWLPADVEHQTTIDAAVRSISILFEPELIPDPRRTARVIAVGPLVREMILYSLRWPIGRSLQDRAADSFFVTLGQLVGEALDHEAPLTLPRSSEPIVVRAMDYTLEHLKSVTAGEVSGAVGVSQRTLRRHFRAGAGMSWRTYLLQARLIRSMALLAERGPSVAQVGTTVGFESVSAFTRAFVARCGESPSAYRRRVLAGSDSGLSEPAV